MNRFTKTAVLIALGAVIIGVLAVKERQQPDVPAAPAGNLPRLVEYGGAKCLNCRIMIPILEDLKREYAGRLEVEFVDVVKDESLYARHHIILLPTQIFYDTAGRELHRHEGVISKPAIVEKWRELGFELGPGASTAPTAGGEAAVEYLHRLGRALEGAPLLALLTALVWGVLSVVLSPCQLCSIPLLIGYVAGQKQDAPRHARTLAFVFALGVLVSIAVAGTITISAGRILGDLGRWLNYVIAAVLVLAGLQMLRVINLGRPKWQQAALKRKGLPGALVLGLIFGVLVGPCALTFLAPVLAVVFKLSGAKLLFGALLLLAYAAGYLAVIVAAGSSMDLAQRWLDWNENSRGFALLKSICGILVILGGLYFLHLAP